MLFTAILCFYLALEAFVSGVPGCLIDSMLISRTRLHVYLQENIVTTIQVKRSRYNESRNEIEELLLMISEE